MDGSYSIDPYLNHTLGIGSKNLTDLTFCLRFKVNYLKDHITFPVSYANILTDNAFLVEINYRKSTPPKISICKYGYINAGTIHKLRYGYHAY